MKVTIGSRIYLPEPAAASFRLGAVADALVKKGAKVTVLTAKYRSPLREGDANRADGTMRGEGGRNPQIKRWPVLRDKTGYVRGYLPYLSFDIPLFFRVLLGQRADVMLVEPPPTTGVMARLACTLKRMPYVWYAADVWSDATKIAGAAEPVVAAVRLMEKFALRGAAGVIAVSDGVADRARELGGRNVRVIPNGIDTDTYHPKAALLDNATLAAMGIHGPYVLYAGTASEWQGARIFADAMEVLADRGAREQLVYVGQGTEWNDIAEVAARLKEKHGRDIIALVDPKSPEVVASLLRGARAALVSIVPGRGYDFAYPTKVLAGLSAGVPVVFAGVGAVANDIAAWHLGEAVGYDVQSVARGLGKYFDTAGSPEETQRLHNWVVDNRSMKRMGEEAADFIRSVAQKG